MSRGLSQAARDYTGPFYWAASFTLTDQSQKYYAESALTFKGITYQGYLMRGSAIEQNRSLRSDVGELRLLNVDLVVDAVINQGNFDGALAEVKMLLLGIDEEVPLLTGLVSEIRQTEEAVELRVVSRLDPAQFPVPFRQWSDVCTFRFKDPQCGYVDGVDPDDPGTGLPFVLCPKTYDACLARSREERFPGFLTITPGQASVVRRTPGAGGRPSEPFRDPDGGPILL